MTAVLAALNARLEAAFGPGQVRAERVLQHRPAVLVAGGWAGAQRVVVKQILGADAAGAINRLAQAHHPVPPHLGQGPFRLARLLHIAPGHGLAVLEEAPGQRMDAALAGADAAERGRLLHLAGGWLAAFAAPRLHGGSSNLHAVIRRRKDHQPPDLPPPDRALTGGVLAAMRALARGLAYRQLALSGAHGDLTPYNLHVARAAGGPEIWGFDLQPPRLRPVAQDAAQLLVVAGLRLPPAPGPLRDGLPEADAARFLEGCRGIDPDSLRFFIADGLLRALHDAAASSSARATAPARADAARDALGHWLNGSPCA